jgi:hypothetical protein
MDTEGNKKLEDFDATRDDPRTKKVIIDTNVVYMKRTDPYGFIELSLERGGLPESIRESKFTTWEAAKSAVDQYISSRGKEELSEKPVIPTLERKKVS